MFLVLAAVPVLGLLARLVDHREKLRPWLAGSLGALVFVHPFYSVALFVGVQTTTTALAALLVFRVLERGFYPAALLVAAWSALSSPVGVFLLAALVLAAPVFLARPWWRGVVYGALGLAAAFVGGSLFLDQAGPLFGGTFFLQKFRHVGSQFVAPGPQTFVVSNVMSTVGLPGFLQSWPPWIPGQILSHPVSLLAYLVEVLYVAGGYMMKVFIPGAVGILILGGRRNFSWSLGILAVAAVSLLFLAASNPVIFPRHHLAVGLWVLIPLGRLLLWMPTRGGLPVLLALFGFLRTAATAEGGLHHRARPENTNHAGFSRLLAPHVEPGALVMGTYPQMYAFLLSRPAAGATLLCSSQALMDAYLNKYRPQWLILDDFRPELKNLSLCRDRKIRIPAEWREFPVPGAEHFSAKAYRRDASAVNTRQSLPANTTSFPGGFRKSAGEKR
ncbi:MAG: hypothetical protein HUU37_02475 [Bdellovibrionales bacterium]|nr:hypothetical protein [Bdellovibrionales bacterium]